MKQKLKKIMEAAGKIALKYYDSRLPVSYKEKENNFMDIVTKADIEVEKFLKKELLALKNIPFLGEEGGAIKKTENCWIVDPIDGTTNFYHKYPFFCVSVALTLNGKVKLGAVWAPALNEYYYAEKGKGAFLNGKKIRVSDERDFKKCLFVTGFADVRGGAEKNTLNIFLELIGKCHGIRRDGSAALNLCYVAKGVFEGFWERNLNLWDIAAGVLLIKEAGGKVTDFKGGKHNPMEIAASNGVIHSRLLKKIKQAENKKHSF